MPRTTESQRTGTKEISPDKLARAKKTVCLVLGQVCIGKRVIVCRRIPHNLNARQHWSARSNWTAAWKTEVYWAVKQNRNAFDRLPVKNPAIVVTFHQIHQADFDNLYGSAKPIVDGLKQAGVIEDDNPKILKSLRCEQKKVNHKAEEHVEIAISFA